MRKSLAETQPLSVRPTRSNRACGHPRAGTSRARARGRERETRRTRALGVAQRTPHAARSTPHTMGRPDMSGNANANAMARYASAGARQCCARGLARQLARARARFWIGPLVVRARAACARARGAVRYLRGHAQAWLGGARRAADAEHAHACPDRRHAPPRPRPPRAERGWNAPFAPNRGPHLRDVAHDSWSILARALARSHPHALAAYHRRSYVRTSVLTHRFRPLSPLPLRLYLTATRLCTHFN